MSDQEKLNRSLEDAAKIARRVVAIPEAHEAALALVRALRNLGAEYDV